MNVKFSLNFTVSFLILTSLILILSCFGFSPVIFHFFCFFILSKIVKQDKLLILCCYLLATLVMIFFYHYWLILYENSYFLGLKSDDFYFDYVWSENFVENFGLDFRELPYHLDKIEPGLGFLHNSKAYVAIIIVLKYFSSHFDGYHTFLPRILNIFFLTLLAYYSSLITFEYSKNSKLRKLTFLAVIFFPVLMFNSAHVFRDTIISFFLIWIYYSILKNKYSAQSFIQILISLFFLLFLRTTTFFISILMIFILYSNIKKINFKLFFVFSVFCILSFFYLNSFIVKSVIQFEAYNSLNPIRFGTIGGKIFSIPIQYGFISRIIYLIFTPVISVTSFHQFFVSTTSIIQILIFPYLISSFRVKYIDLKLKLVFLIFFLGVAFTTADFRHVTMYLPFGIILCILAIDKLPEYGFSKKKYYMLLFGLIVSFFFNLIFIYLF